MARIEFDAVDLTYPVRRRHGVKSLLRRGSTAPGEKPCVHALNRLTFAIADGERVGIVGPNGAGKSTLLRTIGGVYPIQSGRRHVEGSIGSLFDIGVGFEPMATGWDNIRFRAYLQGETPQSLQPKLQQIAEFSELGEFLDLPLSCYSTGMILRLGFAVATAARPDLFLIDEMFTTGDLAFQQKAAARMIDCIDRAPIVVMVSHDLEFLQTFCTRVLWLDQGRLRADGAPCDIIAAYRDRTAGPLMTAAAI
jgi:ABC-type polysaccharide/polyol phosphate transport system ATPase subunit